MPSSGYIANTFVANEQPSTTKWNQLWGNDASFNSGNGFNDNILITRHFATSGLQLPDKTLNPYKFMAYRNAAFNSTTGATALAFDTKLYDTGSNYDTSTGKFTAPIAGFYVFSTNVFIGTATSTLIQAGFYKNGSQVAGGPVYLSGTGNVASTNTSPPLQLAANDFIQVFISNGAGTLSGITGSQNTYFGGFLLSAT